MKDNFNYEEDLYSNLSAHAICCYVNYLNLNVILHFNRKNFHQRRSSQLSQKALRHLKIVFQYYMFNVTVTFKICVVPVTIEALIIYTGTDLSSIDFIQLSDMCKKTTQHLLFYINSCSTSCAAESFRFILFCRSQMTISQSLCRLSKLQQ